MKADSLHLKRIAVIGNAGGGKTTLSRRLAALYDVPVTHVDSIQFLAGMKIRPLAETRQVLHAITAGESWLIDGYGPLDMIERRFRAADRIVLVDFPLWRHYWWCAKRQMKSSYSRRAELPKDCHEFSWAHTVKLFKTIRRVHRQMRPELLRILARESLAEKVTYVRTLSEWRKLFRSGF